MVVRNLILILGDQLTPSISSLEGADRDKDLIVMGELADEATYVRHHKKKLILVFSAMRHFAETLRADGWKVDYQKLDDDQAAASFLELVRNANTNHEADKIIVTEPGEWRLKRHFERFDDELGLPLEVRPDERFICSHGEFEQWAKSRRSLTMEYFYRDMRRKTGLLMEGDDPVGGQWNFDADNRKAPTKGLKPPSPMRIKPDDITCEVIGLVDETFGDHFGTTDNFVYAVTREDAEKCLTDFIDNRLKRFGDFQDAMIRGEDFIFHSIVSFYINLGLLDPLESCKRVAAAYDAGKAPLNAVEGFVRQIIGWREFVRGIYWREGEDYTSRNFLAADRRLPDFYWSGDTDMACMKAAITQTRDHAYAHHIQRLMVTGTFALIAGIDPFEVHEWYLAVYADAYEWVEAPNVIGMSQYADGGILGSKPYAASGAYINRMSDYCKDCSYSVTNKTEENACPFNSLYWDFLVRNDKKLKGNGRLSRVYQNWARMGEDKQSAYLARAKTILEKLDRAEKI